MQAVVRLPTRIGAAMTRLKTALGVLLLLLLFAGPLWLVDVLFRDDSPMAHGSLGGRAVVALLVIVLFDYVIHGFTLRWRVDRRPTWILLAVGTAALLRRLPWSTAWQHDLFELVPFGVLVFLACRDERLYGKKTRT